ncbi:hypothetical protein G8S49_06500 [Clostridium botulinum C]|uniref:Uncharacterized protein n=2 Tax=Clostridium TaxID=1485 RepID=A0A9Q3VAD2_CLOBO|nr:MULTISPECIES: hypothetical protein [Clostridium]YP_398456.1 hypothetical protein CST026 [Clostridium phage c-st]KEI14035.1 hypothetical protein Z960_p0034 [Clostridium haemolyticum NCTC 9693]MCD3196051.1 hypothetical protein [Clostridium botulinum C]MCD3200342.1 hypothetical protein [Clostridium botulinum C]MCD3206875.1 hypothetical protein [Clostridium botulinum C]MCD3207574.1 hypothetical protein [Clostridium botulinum C]
MAISSRIKEMAKQQFLLKRDNVISKATRKAKQEQYEILFGGHSAKMQGKTIHI